MGRPPITSDPRRIFVNPVFEWISRVNRKRDDLSTTQMTAEQKDMLTRWVETEFVCSVLPLDGGTLARDEVDRVVAMRSIDASSLSADHLRAGEALAALRKVEGLVCRDGAKATLSPDLLRQLHSPLDSSLAEFRRGPGESLPLRPVPPERVAASIDVACRWFSADSFLELHPVEQAGIVLLRLVEIQGFDKGNERTARVAASLFTLRAGLPPIIIRPDRDNTYRAALDEGLRISTRPMVELLAEAVESSLTGMKKLIA